MENFENKDYGKYKRYTYTQCDAAVTIEIGEDIFVLNAKEKGDTNKLYRELSERCKAE